MASDALMRSVSRRTALETMVLGAAAGAVHALWPRTADAGQDPGDAALVARVREDLERHASFGDKFSAGPGDLATAAWIASRLQESGYRVEESDFAAPFFVKRAARLTTGVASVDVAPQAPVVPTTAAGVTARLAIVENTVGDVRDRIALVILPSGRHAALSPERGIGRTIVDTARAGARAIVIVTTGPSGEAVALNCPEAPFVPVPAAVLAPKHAERFVAAAKAGADATLLVDGDATERPSRNVVA